MNKLFEVTSAFGRIDYVVASSFEDAVEKSAYKRLEKFKEICSSTGEYLDYDKAVKVYKVVLLSEEVIQ